MAGNFWKSLGNDQKLHKAVTRLDDLLDLKTSIIQTLIYKHTVETHETVDRIEVMVALSQSDIAQLSEKVTGLLSRPEGFSL